MAMDCCTTTGSVRSVYMFVLVMSTFALSSSISMSSAQTCPYHCTCTDNALTCVDGYEIDSTDLRLISKDSIANVTLVNFVIRHIDSRMFERLGGLQSLSIVESRMRTIDKDSFSSVTALQRLDLGNNHIVELPESVLSGLVNLTYINLSHNLIEELPNLLFASQTHSLTHINLSHNRLRLLAASVFKTLTHLEHLDLSNNELSYILPSTFNILSMIRFIDINDNLLVTLHEDLFGTNNVTITTQLSLLRNPLVCNCGLEWLRELAIGSVPHIELLHKEDVVCSAPHAYHGIKLRDVPLDQLNCSQPTVDVYQSPGLHYYKNKVELECKVGGDPVPSVVWKTPMGDLISDPAHGAWLDSSIGDTFEEKLYQVYATGEQIAFTVKTRYGGSVSRLTVSNMHILSSGQYECIAVSPGGNNSAIVAVSMSSPIETQFITSMVFGGFCVLGAILLGIVGCGVTACMEKCSCCKTPVIKYYDGHLVNTVAVAPDEGKSANRQPTDVDDSDADSCSGDELMAEKLSDHNDRPDGPSTSAITPDEQSVDTADDYLYIDSSGNPCLVTSENIAEINEHPTLTAEEWDAYFKEYPGDFVIESLSPKLQTGSSKGSPRGSPAHRGAGRTLETLEGVRLRLKLRVEQIDVMRERLRTHMGKRGARMKDNMAKQKLRMNKRMQTIKESTSHSLQSIRETGRSYSHKLHKGVINAMGNVGDHLLSLKELCGTGELGNTVSIATITTDIDTNEVTAVNRSETEV